MVASLMPEDVSVKAARDCERRRKWEGKSLPQLQALAAVVRRKRLMGSKPGNGRVSALAPHFRHSGVSRGNKIGMKVSRICTPFDLHPCSQAEKSGKQLVKLPSPNQRSSRAAFNLEIRRPEDALPILRSLRDCCAVRHA
jgi:hypothetical protein